MKLEHLPFVSVFKHATESQHWKQQCFMFPVRYLWLCVQSGPNADMTTKDWLIRTEYLTLASCWVKGNCTWIFFMAFSLYKPQICCWVTQPLPLFLWDQAVKQGEAKQCGGCCGLQTAGTVLTIPLAPVGGRQHCWLNKQGHHPALTTVINRNGNRAPPAAEEARKQDIYVDLSLSCGFRTKLDPADTKK